MKAVKQVIPRSPPGDDDMNQKKEWFAMMKGGPAAYSNFDTCPSKVTGSFEAPLTTTGATVAGGGYL